MKIKGNEKWEKMNKKTRNKSKIKTDINTGKAKLTLKWKRKETNEQKSDVKSKFKLRIKNKMIIKNLFSHGGMTKIFRMVFQFLTLVTS